jgi:peptidoglycan hydrolase CwlO-like protein
VVSRPDRHPIDDATEIVDRVLDLIGPPPSPPADPVETWRATFAASGQSAPAQLRQMTAQASELTRLLLETRQALAASQADLTRVEAERDALAVLKIELKVEAATWRAAAVRHLTSLGEVAKALATANYQNRILTAENEAAVRRLTEKEGLQ